MGSEKAALQKLIEAHYTLACAIAALGNVSAWNHVDSEANASAFENAADLASTAESEIAAGCDSLGILAIALPETTGFRGVRGWLRFLRGARGVEKIRALRLENSLRTAQDRLRDIINERGDDEDRAGLAEARLAD
jgi:hypothetical protein